MNKIKISNNNLLIYLHTQKVNTKLKTFTKVTPSFLSDEEKKLFSFWFPSFSLDFLCFSSLCSQGVWQQFLKKKKVKKNGERRDCIEVLL